jgi:hypothetical protein
MIPVTQRIMSHRLSKVGPNVDTVLSGITQERSVHEGPVMTHNTMTTVSMPASNIPIRQKKFIPLVSRAGV